MTGVRGLMDRKDRLGVRLFTISRRDVMWSREKDDYVTNQRQSGPV
jgi:hypothetical protein